jgi:hypothetical protein
VQVGDDRRWTGSMSLQSNAVSFVRRNPPTRPSSTGADRLATISPITVPRPGAHTSRWL